MLGQSLTSGAGFSQIGAGARTQRIGTIFTQGTFSTTSRATDVGIEGQGFFIVDDSSGRSYTRAGIFGFDANGTMVNSLGGRVQGYGIDPVTNLDNGVLGDITLNTAVSPPRATTVLGISLNLDQGEPVVAGGFNPGSPTTTSNFRTVVDVFDSLGAAHTSTIFFTKTAANTWEYNVTLPTSDTSTAPASPTDEFVIQSGGTGTLSFDADGALDTATIPTVAFAWAASSGANSPQSATIGFGPLASGGGTSGGATTQFDTDNALNSFSQDGYAAGSLTSLGIDKDGFLNAVFDNGETTPVARLALANFGNVEGLQSIGNSQLVESRDSGQPLIGAANTGNLGGIRSSSLEESNVDLATQFVKMIVSQRAFQANTRTVSVTNELMANLVNLGA